MGSAQRMKEVYQILKEEARPKIVVLSAMSGTTNSLVEYCGFIESQQITAARQIMENLEKRYKAEVEDLFEDTEYRNQGNAFTNKIFTYLHSFLRENISESEKKIILAQGEILSTNLFHLFLRSREQNASLIFAPDFIRVDENGEPDTQFIPSHLIPLLARNSGNWIITQGFICKNRYGDIDNLKRGGSDYTASLIAAAIKADEIQIWTDIDGMHNNDPRVVNETHAIEHLSFEEAAELAYFGAKILHPSSILPARKEGIPVRLLNTMLPKAKGTYISSQSYSSGIFKAVAAKDGITAIRIRSGRMLMAYGFLRKVFEIFEHYKTPIDLITTSEVAISLTIDDNTFLEDIIRELNSFSEVEVDNRQAVISVVGQNIGTATGISSKVFEALESIFIRMISFGGSNHNISLLINSSDKVKALQLLNEKLFQKTKPSPLSESMA